MYIKGIKFVVAAALAFSISACTVKAPQQLQMKDSIDQALSQSLAQNARVNYQHNRQLPSAVAKALTPGVPLSAKVGPKQSTHFDVNVQGVSANAFFQGLVKGTKYNMIVDPKVDQSITINLKNVTIEEAIDAVCEAYGLGYRKTAYGFRILPDALQTQIFTVSYLDVERSGSSQTSVGASQLSSDGGESGGGASSSSEGAAAASAPAPSNPIAAALGGGSSESGEAGGASGATSESNSAVSTHTQSDFWPMLKKNLVAIVGNEDGRQVVINPQAGIVVVKAYPKELREVAHYLDSTQSIMDRQVILEAKVLEVKLNAGFQAGINWHLLGMKIDNATLDHNYKDFDSIFSLDTSSGGTFDAMIKLLGTQGRVQVLSSPRISTLNNQKAIIKVGGDEFFVTNISNTTLAGSGSTSDQATQDVNLTPFFSGVALDVTPQIGPSGEVTLHIHPIVSEATEDPRDFTVSNLKTENLPLARTTIRETDSIVRAKNGQVIVIGGLMEGSQKNYDANTPGLSQTPLNPLFSRKNDESEKTELIILLRPVVVGANTWSQDISQSLGRFQQVQAPFEYTVHQKYKG